MLEANYVNKWHTVFLGVVRYTEPESLHSHGNIATITLTARGSTLDDSALKDYSYL